MLAQLERDYPCRFGVPVISRVDPEIFRFRYFRHCLQCQFCSDQCCIYGVDVDVENVARIMKHATALEAYVGRPAGEWFRTRYTPDPEYPGGSSTRTRVRDGACVFLNRRTRGCLLHSFSLSEGIDYHELKPMMSALFPITFSEGTLYPAQEVEEGSLVCAGEGPTLYEGAREELRYYFGSALVGELDRLASA